ncbi:hypothetical protein [Salmonella enterica]|uniref:hypothetical protein n=1 Tax=Salmonella enterica TaxID=28901 RepID=UPI003FA79C76
MDNQFSIHSPVPRATPARPHRVAEEGSQAKKAALPASVNSAKRNAIPTVNTPRHDRLFNPDLHRVAIRELTAMPRNS